MRIGNNPNRTLQVDGYAPVVVSAITHLPNLDGYHADRLNVIKASLESMRENAGYDCQIMIWDNGSCDKLLYWLKRSYKPDFLIQSPNVGKSIARASIVNMLPPKTVVGVADDDIYYYPNWLRESLNLLRNYPRVGTVSGWPVRTQFRFHNDYTVKWGRSYASKFEQGRFISIKEDEDFCKSVGRDYKWHVAHSKDVIETKLTFRGIEALATGHHAQWLGYAGVIAPLLRYTPMAMADERPFESAVDRAKLLRLTTVNRVTRHVGNVLDQELEALWRELRS